MANRREEERERLRQAREEKERGATSSERTRLILGYGAAGLIGLLVVAGVVALIASSGGGDGEAAHINNASGETNGLSPDDREGTPPPPVKVSDLQDSAEQAGCDLRLGLKDEGGTHLPVGAAAPEYKTSPPTSGNHVEPPYQQADGAYTDQPLNVSIVHSLEHGRMGIQYSPELPEEDQLALKGLYDTMYGATLFFPNEEMPYAVAAATWTNLLGCPEYKGAATLDAIRAFGEATWGKDGPEPPGAFTIKGPTPKEPKAAS